MYTEQMRKVGQQMDADKKLQERMGNVGGEASKLASASPAAHRAEMERQIQVLEKYHLLQTTGSNQEIFSWSKIIELKKQLADLDKKSSAPSTAEQSARKARDEEFKSYEKLISASNQHIAVLLAEDSAGRKLTESERKLAEFDAQNVQVKDRAVQAKRAEARASLETAAAIEREQVLKQEASKAGADTLKSAEAELKTAREASAALNGKADAHDKLRIAELRSTADAYDMAAARYAEAGSLRAVSGEVDGLTDSYNKLAQDLQASASKKRQTADTLEADAAIKAQNERDKKSAEFANVMSNSVAQSMTDGIMRGFENGKPFAQNFTDSFGNMLKTQVVEASIKGTMGAMMGQQQTGGMAAASPYITAAVVAAAVIQSTGYNRGNKSAAEVQTVQATGTVFGDMAAKSATIAEVSKAIKINSDEGLIHSKGMLAALSQMTLNIGAFASLVVRTNPNILTGAGLGITNSQTSSGRMADMSTAEKWATFAATGGAGLLLGQTNETAITDAGLRINGTVADLMSGRGMQSYVDSNSTVTDWGGLRSRTDANATQYGAVGAEFASNFALIFGDLSSVMSEAGKSLGMDTSAIAATIAALPIDVTASLKDLEGQALADELSKIISNTSDEMAKTLFPSMEKYAQLGEGYTQTVVRVAHETEVVSVALDRIGSTSKPTAAGLVDVAQSLIAAAGGADAYASKMSFFSKNFLSEAQQLVPYQNAVNDAFYNLNRAVPKTREEFAALMQSANVNTEAGQKLHSALLDIAPAFDAVAKASEAAAKAAQDHIKSLQDKAVADYQAATSAVDALKQFTQGLKDFKSSLSMGALSPLGVADKYAQARSNFNADNTAAAKGDIAAQGRLQADATAFLEMSRAVNASSASYTADFNAVQTALGQTLTVVGKSISDAEAQLSATVQGNSYLQQIAANTANGKNNIVDLTTSTSAAVTSAGSVSAIQAKADFKVELDKAWSYASQFVGDLHPSQVGKDAISAATAAQKKYDAMPSYAVGTASVPFDMQANIHRDEKIIDPQSSAILNRYGIRVSGASNDALVAEIRSLKDAIAQSGELRLTVVTPDGKVIKEETITELKRRSKNGEVVVYADGIAA
jgi:hypothetical protein